MAIYDLGTASLAANGEVTGVGTTWKAPLTLIRVGATIIFKTSPLKIYTIHEIISDTQINVYNPNSETVPAGTGYAILAHDGITVQGLAQDVAETLRYYQSRETEVADAVDAFNNFDSADFESKVTQVNTQHGDVVSIGAQVSADATQVTADKDAAAASANIALSAKDAAATSAQEAADYAASLDTSNLLRKDLAFSDLTDKELARVNLDVYSKQDVDAGTHKINGYFLSGDFTQGKKLISNYQSFNYNGNQYSYDGQITEGSVLPSSPELDEKWKLRPISSKIESYGGGVHVADNKDAIIKAIYAGVKVLEFPAGVIRTSEIELNQVASGVKFLGKGGNQAYLGSTIIKPATPNQRSIFTSNKGLSGVDAVKFEGISFDGEWSCQHAILQESGGGWEYRDLSGNRFNTWFIYSGQGLSRFERIYCNATDISDPATFASGGGIRVYSDSVLDTVEIYGGSVPLRLSAGGNRVNNLFCNGGMNVGAIAIEPQDDETNHINTAMSNIYIGETTNTSNSSVPILLISGNDTRRVSGVQISNAHFVHAMTTIESNMVCIRAVNADRIVCSSFDALGKGLYSTPTSRTDVFIDAYNCNSIAFSSGVINGINGHAFRLTNSTGSVDCCIIDEWGVNPRTDELSAIRLIGSSTRFSIGSSVRFNSSLSSTYAIMTENEYLFDASCLSLSYSSPNIILPENENYSYSYKRPGGKITFVNSYV